MSEDNSKLKELKLKIERTSEVVKDFQISIDLNKIIGENLTKIKDEEQEKLEKYQEQYNELSNVVKDTY